MNVRLRGTPALAQPNAPTTGRTGAVPPSAVATQTPRHRADAVSVLTLFVVLLFAIPSVYVIGPLGAIGTPATLVGMGAFGWWLIARFLLPGSRLDLRFQPLRVTILLFGCTILVSFAAANAAGPMPGDQSRSADRGVLYMVAIVGISLLVADGVDSLARLRVLLGRVVNAAALIAAVGIIEYVSKTNIVSAVLDPLPGLSKNRDVLLAGAANAFTNVRRVSGTAVHPIEFGVVLALALPLAAHFALHDPQRKGWRRWWKVVLIALAEPTAQSRSGILVLILACLILLPSWPKAARRRVLQSSPLFAVAAKFIFPGLLGTIVKSFLHYSSDTSVTFRQAHAKLVPHFIHAHPFFGRGYQTFLPSDFFFIDNQYLMSTIETGYVGVSILALLLLTGVVTAFQASRSAVAPEDRLLARAVMASILASAVAFGTFDFLSFPLATGTWFLLVGASGALWRLLRRDAASRRPALVKSAA